MEHCLLVYLRNFFQINLFVYWQETCHFRPNRSVAFTTIWSWWIVFYRKRKINFNLETTIEFERLIGSNDEISGIFVGIDSSE